MKKTIQIRETPLESRDAGEAMQSSFLLPPHRPIRRSRRLRTFFLLTAAFPAIVIGVVFYVNFRNALTRKFTAASLDGLAQTVANIQLKLAEFENISVRLFIHQDFRNTIASYLNARDSRDETIWKLKIRSYFSEYMISHPDIYAFMFIHDAFPERSVVMGKDNEERFIRLSRYFKDTTAYQNILQAGGGIVWSSSIKLGIDHYVVLGRLLQAPQSGTPLGVLTIIVDEERIDRLVNLNVYNKLHITLAEIENYRLIINDAGEIVSTPFKSDIGVNIAQIAGDVAPIQELLAEAVSDRDYGSERNQGSFTTHVKGTSNLITYKTIGSKVGIGGNSGWHLLSLTPIAYLYDEVVLTGRLLIIVAIIAQGIAWSLSYYVAGESPSSGGSKTDMDSRS